MIVLYSDEKVIVFGFLILFVNVCLKMCYIFWVGLGGGVFGKVLVIGDSYWGGGFIGMLLFGMGLVWFLVVCNMV